MTPFFVLQLVETEVGSSSMLLGALVSMPPDITEEQTARISVMLTQAAAEFAKLYPPTPEAEALVNRGRNAAAVLTEAGRVIASAEDGS